jgi:hypothetical protein
VIILRDWNSRLLQVDEKSRLYNSGWQAKQVANKASREQGSPEEPGLATLGTGCGNCHLRPAGALSRRRRSPWAEAAEVNRASDRLK